ncbi:hypothetical protein Hanom_Chr01g00049161 [Helianthus anomalus]
MVTTLGSWKDRFFWVSESIVPFKMIWRHPNVVLNELEPSDSELDSWFLKSIRACPSRLHPFPEPLLVLMGISMLWDKPNQDPVLMRDGQVMSALDFIKSDDTSDVVFADVASTEGEDVVVRGSEHRFEGSGYVSVPNLKGFVKVPASKQSTFHSTRRKCKLKIERFMLMGRRESCVWWWVRIPRHWVKRLEGQSLRVRLLRVLPMLIRGRYMFLIGRLPFLIASSPLPFVKMFSTILPL